NAEKQSCDGKLENAPAKPPIWPPNGKVDPASRAIEQHDANPRPEEPEYRAGLTPLRSQDDADDIFADQSKIRSDGHAYECNHPDRIDKISLKARRVVNQSAERRESHVAKGCGKLTVRKCKQVIRLFVESESSGVKFPAHQQIVEVLQRIP